jgi:hypothetical protein
VAAAALQAIRQQVEMAEMVHFLVEVAEVVAPH